MMSKLRIDWVLFATCCLAASPLGAQDAVEQEKKKVDAVDPAKVPAMIKAALDRGPAPSIAVLEKYGSLPDRAIVAAVARALKHKDEDVKTAAIRALRYNTDKSAFNALLARRADKTIVGRHEITVEYYLALGQHGNSRALPFLLKDLMSKGRRDPALGARFFAIGRMREKAAVEALLRFLRANKRSRKEIYLALSALTGHDAGNKPSKWFAWWRKHHRGYRLPKEQPKLPEKRAQRWAEIWRRPDQPDLKRAGKQKRQRKKRGNKRDGEQGGKQDAGKGA